MGKDVIIALDFDSREKTLAFLDRFTEEKPFVKVGMELFYAEGPAIVREIRRRGHRIAVMAAALGGLARPDGSRPLLIAVSQLIPTNQERMERELLIHAPLEEVVLSYAANAAAAGLDGVVCSPLEAGAIHRRCGADFLTVTPGVRFAGGDAGDQKRVTTPAKARELGSDYIVVGRPITQAEDPVAAYRRCVKEFVG